MAPINEDAVPAFFSKGASVKEAVFGFMMPMQDSNKNIKEMSRGSESQPIPEVNKKKYAQYGIANQRGLYNLTAAESF